MSLVWESAIVPPSLKLTALALADWSNDEGGSLHPAMRSIAKKVGVSKSQAQRLVRTLVDMHLLSVVANANGGAPGETPQYQLHLDAIAGLTGSASATGSTDATGSTSAARRVAPMRQRGSTHATLTVINRHRTTRDMSSTQKSSRLPCPHEQIKALFAETLSELPAIKVWSTKRQTALKARWSETAKAKAWASTEDGLAWFHKFFETVAASDFLMGRGERKAGHESWRCDFDFLMSPKGFVGVIEGKYTNRGAA